jgi:hypothetical protein
MTLSRRRIFSLLGGIAAAVGFGGAAIRTTAAAPNKYIARMNELRMAREAAPAARLGDVSKRGINGLCLEHHPSIYGDGIHDDEPGFTAVLSCKLRGYKVQLPAYRVYRLHKPLTVLGSIEIVDPGVRVDYLATTDPQLTKPLANGYARLFWVEGSLENPEHFKVVDIPA